MSPEERKSEQGLDKEIQRLGRALHYLLKPWASGTGVVVTKVVIKGGKDDGLVVVSRYDWQGEVSEVAFFGSGSVLTALEKAVSEIKQETAKWRPDQYK